MQKRGAILFWLGVSGVPLCVSLQSLIPAWALFASTAVMSAIAFVGIAITRRGRKLTAAARGARVLEEDARPPVVYLRPFSADDQGSGLVSSWPLLKFGYYTEEEQLAMVMNEIGPFIAIGDPKESLPDLGAARIYVGSGEWQSTVAELVSRATLVIMRAGTSDGFWWEFGLVRATVRPERLLLLVPNDRKAYERFCARAAAVLPHPLPDLPRGKRVMTRTSTIIAFETNWRGWALPVVSSFGRTAFTTPYVSRLKLTLRPIFERLGVACSDPPVSRKRMILLATSVVIAALCGLLWLAIVLPEYFYTPPDDPVTTADASTPAPEKSAYDAALEEFGARVSALPEYRAAFGDATDSATARAKGRELSQKGLVRMSDEMLRRRGLVMLRILESTDVETCGAIARGDPLPALEQTLRKLPPEDVREWFDLSFESMAAELKQTAPPPAPPDAQMERAMQGLLNSVGESDGQLLRAMLINPRSGTTSEACRAARLLYQGMNKLPDRSRRVLARTLVMP